jgi:hypothetical protein
MTPLHSQKDGKKRYRYYVNWLHLTSASANVTFPSNPPGAPG